MEQVGRGTADEETARASGRAGKAVAARLAPGARVGRYQILGLIARGGMGEVYAAYHPELDRRIALKMVFGPRDWGLDRQRRLLREAQIIARLNHPNIVTVHDARTVGERVYVAMEFVDGQTIAAWLRETERSWQQIVDAFVSAGRGLAAAHAANVVHRDFKPQNVMIGRDGRVRVMDFGLARPLRCADEIPIVPEVPLAVNDVTSTTVGAVVGTPAYMAPEQLNGHPADTRSDQFSFCVAFHEAIYGVRPSAGTTSGVRPVARIPPWLKRVIRRGLDPDPRKRFGSMEELLRAIERGRNRVRRRLVLLVAGGLILIAAAVGGRAAKARQFACTPPQGRLEAVWPAREAEGTRRASIHRLLLSSGIPDAGGIWNRLERLLDDRARSWVAMYRDACEATHLRGEQSTEVLDLRMTCLNDTLDETRASADGLLNSEPGAVQRALATANELTPIQRCADVKSLRLQVPLPAEPVQRAQVGRLQQRLNDADALEGLRYSAKAEQQIQAVLPAVRALGYAPLLGQALQRLGANQTRLERFAQARTSLEEALFVSESARDDLTAAKAADNLGFIATVATDYDEARRWLRLAESILDRINARDSVVGAWVLNEWANIEYDDADFESSERHARAAIALKTKLLGQGHPDVGVSMNNLANILEELDRWNEALAFSREALAIDEKSADLRSISYALDLLTLGEALTHLRQVDEAEQTIKRALEIAADAGGSETLMFGVGLADLGELLISAGRARDAVGVLERAQTLQIRLGDRNRVRVGVTRAALAHARVESGLAVAAGLQMLPAVCATFEEARYFRRERELLAWFNALPRPAHRQPATSCADLQSVLYARSAPPPVRKLQKDDVARRAVAEVPR
ncbi:MAG TPA: serine/threonine-protein kinase [Polyangia bacterium]|nr:serine/threonine-protein kinase [Polyangia bacterium]